MRRRRTCAACGHRFTTFERAEVVPLMVAKRSGGREPFDSRKIVGGLASAGKGRPIEVATFESLAFEIEEVARQQGPVVSSEWVGVAVLERLRCLDEVTYLRFASVYKDFAAVDDFEREASLIKLPQGQ